MRKIFITLLCLVIIKSSDAEDGYRLWLRFDKINDKALLLQYQQQVKSIQFNDGGPTLNAAKKELLKDLNGLLGQTIPEQNAMINGSIICGTVASSPKVKSFFSIK